MSNELPIVVFDFDGTLSRGDCVARFLRWRLWRNPLRTAPALVLLPMLVWWLRGPIADRGRAASVLLWLATVGLNQRQFDHCIQQFVRRQSVRHGSGLWHPQAVAALNQHQAQGHRVVIATAAFTKLAQALVDLHWPSLPLAGSDLRRRAGGWVCTRHLHGARKVDALIEAGYSTPFACVYSDSRDDQALVDHAQRAIWVDRRSGELSDWRAGTKPG